MEGAEQSWHRCAAVTDSLPTPFPLQTLLFSSTLSRESLQVVSRGQVCPGAICPMLRYIAPGAVGYDQRWIDLRHPALRLMLGCVACCWKSSDKNIALVVLDDDVASASSVGSSSTSTPAASGWPSETACSSATSTHHRPFHQRLVPNKRGVGFPQSLTF